MLTGSDCEKAISRYDEWMQLREQAIENHKASGSTEPLPRSLTETPPPRPPPYVDEDMADVSVDMTANGFDASESFTLDRSLADDMVPNADPEIDRQPVCPPLFA
jgi:serine/threonine-protein phosphatase 2A regulatory subunit B'